MESKARPDLHCGMSFCYTSTYCGNVGVFAFKEGCRDCWIGFVNAPLEWKANLILVGTKWVSQTYFEDLDVLACKSDIGAQVDPRGMAERHRQHERAKMAKTISR